MKIYLVGGAVRDSLLGYPFHERDWVVVGAEPQQLLDQGFQQVGKDFPVFLHPETKEEYALARTERKNGLGYNGFACYSAPDVSLEDDLLRRDLTINAMAQDSHGHIIDPYHGQVDIKHKMLRHVSEAFAEDPLRVLRTARFLARYYHLGFSIAPETLTLMQQLSSSGELAHLSRERIWVETEKALNEKSPEQFFLCLQQCQALDQLYPAMPLITDKTLNTLQKAVTSCKPQQYFALLFSDSQQQDLAKHLKLLKVPNEVAECTQLLVQHSASVCNNTISTQQTLTLFQQADAYRRPERFQEFLQCCEFLDSNNQVVLIKQALALCISVDAKNYAQQGLTGKAIGLAIEQKRLSLLSEIFQNES